MAKKPKLTGEEQVNEYFTSLDHPLKGVMEALRKVILSADTEIGEQIKWNAPAFYYTGDMKPFDPKEYKRDIVVFNIYKNDFVLLVFPTGASIDDQTGLLEGKFADTRKTAKFSTVDEVKRRAKDLQAVIQGWLLGVEKS